MRTETTVTTYRGHEIHVTTHTPNGSAYSYSTAHNDVEGSLLIDKDEKNEKTGLYEQGPNTYETAEQAREASEANIEMILGPAEPEEIGEATADLAHNTEEQYHALNAKRLADSIRSLIANNPVNGNQAGRALRQILNNLAR